MAVKEATPTTQTPAKTAAAPATPAAPGTAASPPAPAAVPSPAPQNLVSAPAAPVIPEKFIIKRADGTIDHEATLLKVMPSYRHFEKRFGSGDVPPETEAGYKLDYSAFPEGVKMNPDGEKALLKSLHASGMTSKQVQTVINKYGEVIKQGLEIQKTQEATRITSTLKDVATELKTAWGANNEQNVAAAIRGFNHIADKTDKADLRKIGIDAKVTYKMLMKVLAKIGESVQEDSQIHAEGFSSDGSLEALKNSEAYNNADHKDHKTTMAKVTTLYQKKYAKK